MKSFWRRLRSCWPGLGILVPAPFLVHASWAAATGQVHWETVAVLVAVLGLFVSGPRAKKLLLGLYPLGLVGLLYTAMRLVRDVGVSPGRVHVCDLRALDARLFGVNIAGGRGTLHDWFQAHPSIFLDALCAIPYGTFLFVCTACAAWLYVRDYGRMLRFGWCWFALNIAGFASYHLYPAAPPWYYHAHGCQIDLLARASEGPNLARVDALLGVHYFAGMYGRSSDTFGAMPSLHVAYALMVVIEGWAVMSGAWRAAAVGYFVLMAFAAVYLDHHWVLDAVAGATYCLVVVAAARLVLRLRAAAARPSLGPAVFDVGDAALATKPPTPNDGAT